VKGRALLAILALGVLAAPIPAEALCTTGHLGARWSGFQAPIHDQGPVFFYHAVEPAGTGSVPIKILGVGDDCTVPAQPMTATYEVRSQLGAPRAANAADFTSIPPRTTGPLYGAHGPGSQEHTDSVPLLTDGFPENVIERADAVITQTNNGKKEFPSEVPLYIVDDDGTERASFENEGPYERSETYGLISVPVFRAGPAIAEATYDITAIPSGSGGPTPGDDYVVTGNPVSFEAGKRVALVSIQIFDDKKAEAPEELTLEIDAPGTVLPDDPVRTTVRILDSIGASGLESRLHHPRPRVTYRASDYRIREIHIFTTPGVGPPVTSADFALRRNLRGGKCSWWTGRKFRNADCQNERWLRTDTYEPDFFYYRLQELDPSKGRIKNYTAFSRARNGAGEIESFLAQGRNANTFEVKPPKR